MSTPDPYTSGTPDHAAPTPPPAGAQPGAYPGQAPGAPQYPQGQPAPGHWPPPQENPGKTLGIVGLVLGFLGPLSLVGLVLSIVGLVKSRRAGQPNGVAIAGIVVGALVLIGTVIVAVLIGVGMNFLLEQCEELGPGVHDIDGVPITC